MTTSTSIRKRKKVDDDVVYYTFEDSSDEDRVDRHRHTTHQLSAAPNRRHDVSSRTTYFNMPKSPQKATNTQVPAGGNESADESTDFHHTTFQENGDEEYELFLDELDLEPVRRKRTKSDHPMKNWIPYRDEFLDEVLRLEGRGGSPSADRCPKCSLVPGTIRCRDCHGTDLYCDDCTRIRHSQLPLHRVERWSGTHFSKASLKALGVRVQLGHGDKDECCAPRGGSDTFVVLDVLGIHEVAVNFCGCSSAQQHRIQLLRARWYPASLDYPKTAATFRLLEQFQMHNFESKGSAWHFYRAIARLTDNTGCDPPKDRYEILNRMVQQWRHIRGLKRSGRGHDPSGVDGTAEGECAVLCPACPQPMMNLPDDWKNASPEVAWLYTLILAMDANFRLKRKKVSSEAADPALSKGWSYFVEERAFKDHIRFCPTQEDEPRTCTGFAAIRNANTRDSKGLAATGVAAVVCARHQIVRPTSVGDLQKGERYVNMDYVFLSTLRGQEMNELILSYDVACQWSVNFRTRLGKFPADFQGLFELPWLRFRTKVPNFHIPAHRRLCHTDYSLHLTSGTGQTDGESIERAWSITNALGPSTKEMGPERRRSTLDDHFGDGNWGKLVNMGPSLLRKMKLAVPQRNEHTKAYLAFTKELKEDTVRKWTELINDWDVDKTKENPYEIQHNTITLAAVRLNLAREEDLIVQDGATFLHEVTPSVLLTTGLELEEQQRRLRADVALQSSDPTSLQAAKLQERRTLLRRRIESWQEIQAVYIPCVVQIRRTVARLLPSSARPEEAEDIPLYLPSDIISRGTCDLDLQKKEWRLRFAQANEALTSLRNDLRFRSYLYKDKDKNVTGQGPSTRARSLINRASAKAKYSASIYRTARTALTKLGTGPDGEQWETDLHPLLEEDLRNVSEGTIGQSEGNKSISWIWSAPGIGDAVDSNGDPGLHDAIRVEWAKARARAHRWQEEVQLLLEEMRRVLTFLARRAEWWRGLIVLRNDIPEPLAEGLSSYAHRQAALNLHIRERCQSLWSDVPVFAQLGWADLVAELD